jgi:glycosyltransferase involved in cell wall biosynthesis
LADDQKVSVVMPAYNEETNIAGVLQQLEDLEVIHEVLVVDDGSQDRTVEIAGTFPKVRVIQHPYNIGNGGAIKTGIRNATGDVIILMDSDGQHPPSEIPHLLEHLGRYDMVVGARTLSTQATRGRLLANSLFNWYASYIVGRRVPDLTSGFRVLKAQIARNFVYLLPNGFSYPTTLTIAFFRAGYAVKYQTFDAKQRGGQSHIRPLKDGFRFLLTLTRLAVLFVPLKIFLPVSLALTTAGFGYVVYRLVTVSRFSGFGGMLATAGIFIFMLGLIAEQIALLRLVNSER